MGELRSARECAERVAARLSDTTADRILMPSRGRPADVLGRRLAMWLWRGQTEPPQTFTATGRAFGRDRTGASSGIAKLFENRGVRPVAKSLLWDDHPFRGA